LAETVIGLYKTEVIRRRGPWSSSAAVELATLEWVDWFNHRRLPEPIGNIPPAEEEALHYETLEDASLTDVTQTKSPPANPGRLTKLEAFLRKAAARTLDAFTPDEGANYFTASGCEPE
jgi:hypothetical protein